MLNYVTLTLDMFDRAGNSLNGGTATFTPTAQLTDATGHEIITQAPVTAVFRGTGSPSVKLLATGSANVLPAGWAWTVTFAGVAGSPAGFSFFLPYSGGASQNLSALAPVSGATAFQAYMPLPSGTAAAGDLPVATGSGSASAWSTLSQAGITRSATLTVASAIASAADRAAADYVCDGTADDVQINAAFAALPSMGGEVRLTEGTFYISSPLVPVLSSTKLRGAGIGATSVNLANGANCNGYQFTSSAQSLIFCSIQALTLEGNIQANTSGYGVYINPTSGQTFWDFHLRDVDVVGWAQDDFWAYDGHGYVLDHIIAEGAGGWGVNMPNTGNGGQAEIRNSTIKKNLGGGIQIAVSGSVVAECEVANNGGYGIQALSLVSVRDNTVYSNTLSAIYMDSNTTLGCRAEGNVVFGNTQHGILALATGSVIIGNWLSANSAGSNGFDEIQVQRGNSVAAFNWVNGGSQSRYGINFNATSAFSGNVCYGNQVVSGSEHTALYNFGTGSVTAAHDNAGYNPVGVVTPAVPSSGSAVAAQPYDRTFYVTAGASTVTCAIQGGPSPVIPSGGFATIRLPATLTLTPTYSSAPTWVVEGE